MDYYLLIIALGLAVLDWIAVARQWKRLEYVAKPGVMLVLLLWLGLIGGFTSPMLWFSLGILFSLFGDIFLMLPREIFTAGLVAFLLAHLSYIIGLNQGPLPFNLATLIIALMVIIVAVTIFRQLNAGLKAKDLNSLRLPVLVYCLVISLMLFSALMTLVKNYWMPVPALMVSFGALFFFLSDAFLGWNKFVDPLKNGRIVVIVTYHLGQILIVLGAALHFLT